MNSPDVMTPAEVTRINPPRCLNAQRGEITTTLAMRYAGQQTITIEYELLGPASGPVVVVAGGISAHRHLKASVTFPEAGWLDELIQFGHTLDPGFLRLLAINYIGASGQPDLPIDTVDQAKAFSAVLQALNIPQITAFVGYSYGALIGLQFAKYFPKKCQRLVAVSGAHRPHPYAAAWRAVQRAIVRMGDRYPDQQAGLALSRQLAMLSYRTPQEFAQRFAAPAQLIDGQVRVAAEDYLDYVGWRFSEGMSRQAFLRLSESIDLHSVDPATITVPTSVIAVHSDCLVPLTDAVTLVEGLGQYGSLYPMQSLYGHDAFLKETDRIEAILAKIIGSDEDRS